MFRFTILQATDMVLTLIGFHYGAQEVGPLARLLIAVGPVLGLLMVKAVAFGLYFLSFRIRPSVLPKVDLFFSGLVIWNVIVIAAQTCF
jgi:hypothetical protein